MQLLFTNPFSSSTTKIRFCSVGNNYNSNTNKNSEFSQLYHSILEKLFNDEMDLTSQSSCPGAYKRTSTSVHRYLLVPKKTTFTTLKTIFQLELLTRNSCC